MLIRELQPLTQQPLPEITNGTSTTTTPVGRVANKTGSSVGRIVGALLLELLDDFLKVFTRHHQVRMGIWEVEDDDSQSVP